MKTPANFFLILTPIAIGAALCILNSASAQQPDVNGIYGSQISNAIGIAKTTGTNTIDTASSVCGNPNTFWGVDQQTLEVKEFDLTNNSITYTGNSVPAFPGYSLCIANNLNGGAITPTIYTSNGNNAFYWDGSNSWVQVAASAAVPLHNGSGAANNLYFESLGITSEIVKYDGASFSTIYTTTKLSGCADIAVDAAGNFIYVGYTGNSVSDTIYIISSAGQIINQYPFVLNVANAYGCFLLNSVFYIGLGSGNSAYPNSLIPVTFTGSAANMGTPIYFPSGTIITYDLASCNPGSLESINSNPEKEEFTLSPIPAKDNLVINTGAIQSATYALYDVTGKIVIPATAIISSTTNINISQLKKGIYFTEIKNSKGVVRKKFAKM